jgi:Ca2+-binding RTX toxin-like protein
MYSTQKIGSLTDELDDSNSLPMERKDKKGKGKGKGKGKSKREEIGTQKADVLVGDASNNSLYGRNGKDSLDGGEGDDTLEGGNGHDRLTGGNGNDVLLGGNGKDTLVGGAGNDTLTGGNGKDIFVVDSLLGGVDTITDFKVTDVIDMKTIFSTPEFAGVDLSSRFQQFVQLVQVGTGTEIRVDADGNGVGTSFTTLAVVQNVVATSLNVNNVVIG